MRDAQAIMNIVTGRQFNGQAVISHESAATLVADLNKGNRRVRSSLVAYLRRQIETGEWQPDHPQPIVFSDAGRLIDGQHRLMAIAQSGQTVVANVVTGARDALREYIDTGTSRQLEDRVSFDEDINKNRRIAILLNQWAHVFNPGTNKTKSKRLTPMEAMDIFVQHRAGIMFVDGYMARKQRGLTAAPVMLALCGMWERSPVKAEEFAEALFSPDCDIQQARRLREYLIAGTSLAHSGGIRLALYYKAVGAMKAYLEGRQIHQLRSASWD